MIPLKRSNDKVDLLQSTQTWTDDFEMPLREAGQHPVLRDLLTCQEHPHAADFEPDSQSATHKNEPALKGPQ
jgi:hypothetical protein